MIAQVGIPVVRVKLMIGNHSLSVLAMCNTRSSISFVDRSIVSTLQLQGRKASLWVAGIQESQDVKTEIVSIVVSTHKKSQPLTTVQFYVLEKLKLGDQTSKSDFHLKNLPNKSYNLNEVQEILAPDCYNIHHPLEFKKSNDKTAPWAVKS